MHNNYLKKQNLKIIIEIAVLRERVFRIILDCMDFGFLGFLLVASRGSARSMSESCAGF